MTAETFTFQRDELPLHFFCGNCEMMLEGEQLAGFVKEKNAMGDLWGLLPVCADCLPKGDVET